MDHGYLGAGSLSEAFINDTLVNEGLHAISIYSIKCGLVPFSSLMSKEQIVPNVTSKPRQ